MHCCASNAYLITPLCLLIYHRYLLFRKIKEIYCRAVEKLYFKHFHSRVFIISRDIELGQEKKLYLLIIMIHLLYNIEFIYYISLFYYSILHFNILCQIFYINKFPITLSIFL